MSILRNYHTHTSYCDGKNTPEEIVLEAAARGFEAIGFSGHSHTAFDESYAMSRAAAEKYRGEITALKEKYRGRIEIYCGIEQDFYSDEDPAPWDYVIGSVHYVLKNGEYIPVDESEEILTEAVRKHYGGDIYGLIEDYFSTAAQVAGVTGADIIGHFDLITKFNEGEKLFSESDGRYVRAYRKALETLGTGVPFEINTGAMSRGYRSVPYPSEQILRDLRRLGGKIALSSDSHEKSTLDYAFPEAEALAKRCGFSEIFVITEKGPAAVKI